MDANYRLATRESAGVRCARLGQPEKDLRLALISLSLLCPPHPPPDPARLFGISHSILQAGRLF